MLFLFVPLLLGVITAPFAKPILLRSLEAPPQEFAEGLNATTFRLAILLAGTMLIWSYSMVIRGKDRLVLDPFPVDGADFPSVLAKRLLRQSLGLLLGAIALLTPVASAGHATAFWLAAGTLTGGWLVGIGVGFPLHLAAAKAATSESLEAVLHAIRGENPAMQAAWIYAPGVGLLLCGGGLTFATAATASALVHGSAPLGLLVPPAIGAVCFGFAGRLAHRHWYLASTLVREIDSAYAGLEDPDEAHIAYLEWSARWAPSRLRPHLLRAYRQGWRAMRPWTLAPVLGGGIAAVAGWSQAASAPNEALQISAFTILCAAAVALRMAVREPPGLNEAIGIPTSLLVSARATAVWAWQQPAVLMPLCTVALAHGAHSLQYAAALELLTVVAAILAGVLSPLRTPAVLLYAPSAIALWVLTVGGIS